MAHYAEATMFLTRDTEPELERAVPAAATQKNARGSNFDAKPNKPRLSDRSVAMDLHEGAALLTQEYLEAAWRHRMGPDQKPDI